MWEGWKTFMDHSKCHSPSSQPLPHPLFRWISDEVLSATLVLLTFCFVITFISFVISIRSVLELRELVVHASSYMGAIAPTYASTFSELATNGLEVAIERLLNH